MRVALFVEGSHSPCPPRRMAPLLEIWCKHLPRLVGVKAPDIVIPISKKTIVAMDPANPPMSGAGEALDQLMARVLSKAHFDAAVVAWDLEPQWGGPGAHCRWNETLQFYELLGESKELPSPWPENASRRWEELRNRPHPSARKALPRLAHGDVLALCMDPMFESLLTMDEGLFKAALGVSRASQRLKGWPRSGWGDPSFPKPDVELFGPALRSARSVVPTPAAFKQVRGDMRTNKDGWGEFILRQLASSEGGCTTLQRHPIARRFAEVLPAA